MNKKKHLFEVLTGILNNLPSLLRNHIEFTKIFLFIFF